MNAISPAVANLLSVGGWSKPDTRAIVDPIQKEQAKLDEFARFSAWMGGISLGDAERLAARRVCGISDQVGVGSLGAAICRWQKTDLTYRVTFTKDMGGYSPGTWRSIVRWGCDRVQEACGLTFTEVEHANADLVILSDRYSPFGSVNGVLATCELPCSSTDRQLRLIYDEIDPWAKRGMPFSGGVTLHELLHGAGLGHSNDPGSIMYPYITSTFVLTNDARDDLAMYGKPKVKPTPTPIPIPTPPQTPLDIIFSGPLVGTDATGRTVRVYAR